MTDKFGTVKVSNNNVRVVSSTSADAPARGGDWFKEPYANIFLLAKKKSGKTTVLENILKRCAGPKTKFIFIATTVNKDASWVRIKDYWEKKGNEIAEYDSLEDEEGKNVINEFIELQKLDSDGEAPPNTVETKREVVTQVGNGVLRKQTIVERHVVGEGAAKKKKAPKMITPEYIICMDDMGTAMRNKHVTQLLKVNRHYKTKVILSAQNISDLEPGAIRQLDYCLVFGRQPEDKVKKLREQLDLDVSEEDFFAMYRDATAKLYGFLYIGREGEDVFRKGFTQQYIIE